MFVVTYPLSILRCTSAQLGGSVALQSDVDVCWSRRAGKVELNISACESKGSRQKVGIHILNRMPLP